tara:strand:+ start:333 stop:488 length:156 start_codon:yes stop_codon:yes gene_type:complete
MTKQKELGLVFRRDFEQFKKDHVCLISGGGEAICLNNQDASFALAIIGVVT